MKKVLLATILSFSALCTLAQESVRDQLQGAWWYTQYDYYYEVIFTDSLIWSYTDEAGVWPFKYVVNDSVIARKHVPWGQQARPLIIRYITKDSIGVESSSAAMVYRRADIGLDEATIQKLLANDPETISAYISAYRQRSKRWQRMSQRTNNN